MITCGIGGSPSLCPELKKDISEEYGQVVNVSQIREASGSIVSPEKESSSSSSISHESAPQRLPPQTKGIAALDNISVSVDETVKILINHKSVQEKIADRDKKLAHLAKRFEKESEKIRKSQVTKEDKMVQHSTRAKLSKTPTGIVKVLTDRYNIRSTSVQLNMLEFLRMHACKHAYGLNAKL